MFGTRLSRPLSVPRLCDSVGWRLNDCRMFLFLTPSDRFIRASYSNGMR